MTVTHLEIYEDNKGIQCEWIAEDGLNYALFLLPHRSIPDYAPQEMRDLAAEHWTPEVIAESKARWGIKGPQ